MAGNGGAGNRTAAASLSLRRRCAAVFPPVCAAPAATFRALETR